MEAKMADKSFCTKKKLLFPMFLVFCFFVICVAYIYRLGIDHGRKMEAYLSSPWQAWQKIMLITETLEGRAPDCTTELFYLDAEIITYRDSVPGWEKIFFSDQAKKQELKNEKTLERLKNYRGQYPLTEAYFDPCKDKGGEYFEIYKERTEEAWNYIMNK
jgi:hypothetical protein